MKASAKPKLVREVSAPYRARRKPGTLAKCRVLTGKELASLAEKMIEAHERGDRAESKRIERELINGWYGEIRA